MGDRQFSGQEAGGGGRESEPAEPAGSEETGIRSAHDRNTLHGLCNDEGSVLGRTPYSYTSPGGQTALKITRSMDVKAEKSEKEADRQRGVKPPYYATGNWDLVTIEGELRVRNYKSKSVTLLVKKTLSGEVLADVPKAQVEAKAEGVWHLNPQQVLTWEIPLQSGGKASLTYRYKAYVAR